MGKQGELVIRFVGDTRDLRGGFKDAEGHLGRFSQRATRAGQAMSAVGKKLTVGLTLPLVAAGLKSLDAASDLNEAMSKVNVVFGRSAREIQDWAKTASTSMGMSRRAALESAGTIGNLFVALKLPQQEASKMSTKIVQLAGDLASFNNVDPTEALDALRAGLVGETEPLRRFGVNLNDATLRQKALAMGLVKTTREVLPPAVKAQASYALILEQTTTAQGDFARTADGVANRTRIAKAQFEDAAAVLGQRLLPVGQKMLAWASDLALKFQALSPATQDFIVKAGAIGIALGPVIAILGNFAKALGTLVTLATRAAVVLANPFGALALAAVAVPATLVLVRGALHKFGEATSAQKRLTDEFTAALDRSRDAMNRISGANRDAKDAQLSVEESNIRLRRAEEHLAQLRKSGGRASALDIKEAEIAVRRARLGHSDATRASQAAEEKLKEARDRAKASRKAVLDDIRTEAALLLRDTSARSLYRLGINSTRGSSIALSGAMGRLAEKILAAGVKGKDLNTVLRGLPKDVQTRVRMLVQAEISAKFRSATIRQFHSGGVVPGSVGTERLAVVKAGEVIRTPQQERALGGGGGGVVINVYAANYGSVRELGDVILKELRARRRQTGALGLA